MIAFCAALKWEVRPVLRSLREVRRGDVAGVRIWAGSWASRPAIVYQTGVGLTAAAAATMAVCHRYPIDLVVNSGCAGGLTQALAGGAVVIPNAVLSDMGDGPQSYVPHQPWSALLRSATDRAKLTMSVGSLLTSPIALETPDAKGAAHQRWGAVAVDMETAAVARTAAEIGIPFASIRVVLDPLNSALPQSSPPPRRALKVAGWSAQILLRPAEMRRLLALANDLFHTERGLDRLFKSLLEVVLSRQNLIDIKPQ